MEFEEEFKVLREKMMKSIHAEIMVFMNRIMLILPEQDEGKVMSFDE